MFLGSIKTVAKKPRVVDKSTPVEDISITWAIFIKCTDSIPAGRYFISTINVWHVNVKHTRADKQQMNINNFP